MIWLKQAQRHAESLMLPDRSQLLSKVAVALAETSEPAMARDVSENELFFEDRDKVLHAISASLAQMGQHDEARQLAEDIRLSTGLRDQALVTLSIALARSRAIFEAMECVEAIGDKYCKVKALLGIAVSLADAEKQT